MVNNKPVTLCTPSTIYLFNFSIPQFQSILHTQKLLFNACWYFYDYDKVGCSVWRFGVWWDENLFKILRVRTGIFGIRKFIMHIYSTIGISFESISSKNDALLQVFFAICVANCQHNSSSVLERNMMRITFNLPFFLSISFFFFSFPIHWSTVPGFE